MPRKSGYCNHTRYSFPEDWSGKTERPLSDRGRKRVRHPTRLFFRDWTEFQRSLQILGIRCAPGTRIWLRLNLVFLGHTPVFLLRYISGVARNLTCGVQFLVFVLKAVLTLKFCRLSSKATFFLVLGSSSVPRGGAWGLKHHPLSAYYFKFSNFVNMKSI